MHCLSLKTDGRKANIAERQENNAYKRLVQVSQELDLLPHSCMPHHMVQQQSTEAQHHQNQ